MSDRILEVVSFATLAGTDEDQFIGAVERANAALQGLPGFLARRFSKTADGTWMDLVEWEDADSAANAAKIFHTLPAAQPFCRMIDMETAKMAHYKLMVTG